MDVASPLAIQEVDFPSSQARDGCIPRAFSREAGHAAVLSREHAPVFHTLFLRSLSAPSTKSSRHRQAGSAPAWKEPVENHPPSRPETSTGDLRGIAWKSHSPLRGPSFLLLRTCVYGCLSKRKSSHTSGLVLIRKQCVYFTP